ncbi:MAG: general secretion pathway protein GspK [Deltaproteobacteria bacterium]|nr:general secretion pathway protein GspK [Deltaproteobacteria bacterium]
MALLVTISALSLLIAMVGQFAYGTTVDLSQAANARDEVRAHYLARSAMSLSRLLIKIQLKFVEPVMRTAQDMLNEMAGEDLGISLRVTDYTGPLLGFFSGNKTDVALLGTLVGIDTTEATGLDLVPGRMSAEITNEDGKIDINCGAGPAPMRARQLTVFRLLSALTMSPRYDLLFSTPDAEGRYVDRVDLARALLDWSDSDEQMFSIDANAAGPEDYRYDQRSDPYLAHDNYYDTVGETSLVRGMNADFAEAFRPYLTTYASDPDQNCRVNLASIKGDCTPLLVGLVRAALIPDPSKIPEDPSILDDDRLYPLVSVLCERGVAVGFSSLDTVIRVLTEPAASLSKDDPRFQMMQNLTGVNINKAQLATVAYVGPPRVYRVVATGESGKVKKRITAILDTARTPDNPVTVDPANEKAAGVIQYWREE